MQEKNTYVLFGGPVSIGSLGSLTKLGDSIMLDAEMAADVVLGGGAILPKDVFDKIGFTAAELDRGHKDHKTARASEAHLLRFHKAIELGQELRKKVREARDAALEAVNAPKAEQKIVEKKEN